MHLNITSAKWRPFCPGRDELSNPKLNRRHQIIQNTFPYIQDHNNFVINHKIVSNIDNLTKTITFRGTSELIPKSTWNWHRYICCCTKIFLNLFDRKHVISKLMFVGSDYAHANVYDDVVKWKRSLQGESYHDDYDEVDEVYFMMTSSNGNIFRVTGHLCGEFTGPRWIPHTKASDAELWCFLWSVSE